MILLFYKYVTIAYPTQMKKWQHRLCESLGLTGRIILAEEGINGTLGGSAEAAQAYIAAMQAHALFKDIDFKTSEGSAADFPRLAVVVKPEIVNLGVNPRELPATLGGAHLTPEEAHSLMEKRPEDLVILDARNIYESDIGAFEGAVKAPIENFRDLPEYIDTSLEQFRNKTVLMYCTGGVRCERASAYLKTKGVAQEVYQIQGGIHRYAEKYPDGFFKGKNYVFDKRHALPVTEDVIGNCSRCSIPSDEQYPCAVSCCHRQIIICTPCVPRNQVLCHEHENSISTHHALDRDTNSRESVGLRE